MASIYKRKDGKSWRAVVRIKSDIMDDFYMIAKEIQALTKDQKERLYYSGEFTFYELCVFLQKNGYSKSETITEKLLELYSK